ncbi:MAG: methyltransferase domain-containing protein [Verrucomicrobia bacterium]|nr:methyltransferase domain-containing protein [Verrucomicrobiota bacterium]
MNILILIMANMLTTHLNFFWAGLLKQSQTGALVPSQRFLVAKMIAPVPETCEGLIIELGAGTGALTLRLAAKCPKARIVACEINPTLARECRNSLTRAGYDGRVEVVSAAAEQLLAEYVGRKTGKPEFVISGIPLGHMDGVRARHLLDIIRQSLAEGGMYIQFQHSLLDRKNIRTRFVQTHTVPALLNFPPAVVYYAQN